MATQLMSKGQGCSPRRSDARTPALTHYAFGKENEEVQNTSGEDAGLQLGRQREAEGIQ